MFWEAHERTQTSMQFQIYNLVLSFCKISTCWKYQDDADETWVTNMWVITENDVEFVIDRSNAH